MWFLVSLVTLPLLWTGTAGNKSWSLHHRHSRYAPVHTLVAERSFIPNSTSSATHPDVHGEPFFPNSTSSATHPDVHGEPFIPNSTSSATRLDVHGEKPEFNLSDTATVTPYFMNRSHLALISPRAGSSNTFYSKPLYSEFSDDVRNHSYQGEITTLENFNSSEDTLISHNVREKENVTLLLQPDASFHSSQLRESMSGLRRSMFKLGLVGKCSTLPREEVERSAAQIMDHVLLKEKGKNEDTITKSWKKNHPVSEMLQLVFNGLPNRVKKCADESSNIDYYDSDLLNMMASLDPELVEFLSYKIMPVKEYFGVDSEEILELSLPILDNICRNALKVMDDELMLCLDDLSFLVKVIATGALERSSDTRRYKRYAEVISDAVREHGESESGVVRRDGYGDGGYGGETGYYSKDYKDPPSYVIIPDSGGYDYFYPHLLKFLSALTLGTYGFLGLLCFHTFLKAGANTGPPGLKGFKGILGSKGMSGPQGMKGTKGAVGPDGDQGPDGEKGETGDIGMMGIKGVKGSQPPTGPNGSQGPPGPPGPKAADGPAGDPGPPGTTGGDGKMGVKGPKGMRGRRSIERVHDYGIGGELLDSPQLLQVLYQMLEEDQPKVVNTDIDLFQRINFIWKAYKNPPNCVRCKLFDFLQHQDFESLEPYIIAGFSHLLGDSESFQLLDDVREGKKRGTKLRCRRQKNTCKLEHLGNI